MNAANSVVLAEVVALVRDAINEDWILDLPMDAGTSLNRDLEIESMDFVAIAGRLQAKYGEVLDLANWFAGKDIRELVNLTVGDLATHVCACTGRA